MSNISITLRAQQTTNRAFAQTKRNMDNLRRSTGGMNSSVLRNRRLIQQAGMQLSDFAVQVGGGQSAILAFTQNVPQFVQGFGAIGGALAAVITIAGTLALVISRTAVSLDQITPIAGVFEQQMQGLVTTIGRVKEFMIDFANVVVNNLDRLVVYISTFVAFALGRMVVQLVAAQGAVTLLTGALVALRAIATRLLFVGLLVGAGEIIFMFIKLVKETGSMAGAMEKLGPLFRSISQAMYAAMQFAVDGIRAFFLRLKATVLEVVASIDQAMVSLVRGGMKGLASVVEILDKDIARGELVNAMDNVQTSFTGAGDAAERARESAESYALASSLALEDVPIALKQVGHEWRELRKITNSNGSDINIRDWFGGSGSDAAGGGSSPSKNVEDITKKVRELGDAVADTVKSSFDRMFDSIFNGSQSAVEALRNMGIELLKLVAKQQLFTALANRLPNLFGAGGFSPLVQAVPNTSRVTPFANGGVLNGPAVFPMRGGTGIAGEAGPEAILPLTRRNGVLGVQGGTPAPTNIAIINNANVGVDYQPTDGPNGIEHRFVVQEINRTISRGEADASMRGRFGQQAQRKKR